MKVFEEGNSVNRNRRSTTFVMLGLVAVCALGARAEEPSDAERAQANNPLASFKTFNLHDYYTTKLYGVPDETSNTFWLRYAQPVGQFLVRASLPIPTVPVAGGTDSKSGIGDFNAFATYLAVSKPSLTFGAGPLIVAPTATNDALGSGKWQAGAAAILFAVPSPQVQYGALVTWQTSFAGDSERDTTNTLAAQMFGILQLGGGTYLRSTGVWVFNLRNGDYSVPIGLGIGKVVKAGKTVYNVFVEPQYTVLHQGVGQPAFQVFFGINMQFKGS